MANYAESSPAPRSKPNLRRQLMLAFGLLSLLLAGVLAISLIGLVRLRSETQQAIMVVSAKSRQADEIAIATLLCRRYEKDLFLNLDAPATRVSYLEKWQQAYQSLQEAIDRYAMIATTTQEQQQVAQWRHESQLYQQAVVLIEGVIASGAITTPQAANAALAPYKD